MLDQKILSRLSNRPARNRPDEEGPATAKITKRSTMQEVLEAYPSAQRALFHRYHIGGCHGCGYQPQDILEEVAQRHDIHDLDEVIAFIEHAEEIDRRRALEALPDRLASPRERDEAWLHAERSTLRPGAPDGPEPSSSRRQLWDRFSEDAYARYSLPRAQTATPS